MRINGYLSAMLAACAISLVGPAASRADLISFSGTGSDGLSPANSLSATATFSMNGTQLVIDVQNTGAFTTLDPVDVLTAVYFDINGQPALTGPTAAVATGSVLFDVPGKTAVTAPSSLMVSSTSGGWDYATGATGGVSQYYGLGTVGLDRFDGSLTNAGSGSQSNYGVIQNVTYTKFTGNLKNTNNGQTPLVKDTIEFTLSGLSKGFNLTSISNVRFQYGTSNSEPSFTVQTGTFTSSAIAPEPSTILVAAVGAIGFVGYGLTRRARSRDSVPTTP